VERKWWTLVGACSGLFLLMLDSTVVALALSSIRADLGSSAAELQWVMNGYLLTIAVLVVTAGRLGDMFGRKRIFVLGMALFGLVYAPMSTAAMAAMPAEKVGIASGVLAMDRIVAGSLALAATGAAFHGLQAGGESFSDSIAGATWVSVALCTIGAVLTWSFVRDPEQAGSDHAVAGSPPPGALLHHRHHRRFHL
jgi:MFS family permease